MPRLLRGIARTAVVAGTATAVSHRVSRRQTGRWAAQDQQPPPQPPATGDPIAQLKDLAELRSQGVLTEAEFQAQKQRLLG